MFNKILLFICFLTVSSLSYAKSIEIEMLNKLGKERMVYTR